MNGRKEKIIKIIRGPILLTVSIAVMAVSVWGPEQLTYYQDNSIFYKVQGEAMGPESEGFRYLLSGNEKLYLLSKCLNNQILPQSDQNALVRAQERVDVPEFAGSYAFVVKQEDSAGELINQENMWEHCRDSMAYFYQQGILPEEVKTVEEASYSAVLYSAIDVLEPRNNMAVWKVSLTTDKRNADKAGRMIDVCLDADTGKVYEFYVRCNTTWEALDPDAIIAEWSEYVGLTGGEAYEEPNPLLETTPYYKKYSFPGNGQENTIVTIGFYEGINELFLKISR